MSKNVVRKTHLGQMGDYRAQEGILGKKLGKERDYTGMIGRKKGSLQRGQLL